MRLNYYSPTCRRAAMMTNLVTISRHSAFVNADAEYLVVPMVGLFFHVALARRVQLTLLVLAPVAYCMVRIVD